MADETNPDRQSAEKTQPDLKQLAALLRRAEYLKPDAQKSLATLLDELAVELSENGVTSTQALRLEEAVAEVARSLHRRESAPVLEKALNKLKDAAIRAEVEAPVATGLAVQFIDLLASIGI